MPHTSQGLENTLRNRNQQAKLCYGFPLPTGRLLDRASTTTGFFPGCPWVKHQLAFLTITWVPPGPFISTSPANRFEITIVQTILGRATTYATFLSLDPITHKTVTLLNLTEAVNSNLTGLARQGKARQENANTNVSNRIPIGRGIKILSRP